MSALGASVQQNISGSGNIFTATGDVFVIQKPESATDRQVQTNLRILLNKVRTFWVQGVLEKSIHHAVFINLEKEVRTDSVDHPWGMVLELPDNERHTLPPKTDIIEIFIQSTRALLVLGEPGSGKTTTLLDLARKLIEKAEQDISTEPIPVVFNLSSWGTSKSLFEWLAKELSDKYQIPKKIGNLWLEQNRILPLLDGFDEIAEAYRQNCVNAINEFIGDYGLPGLVVCSRITEYTKLPVRLKLNAAICVQPLSEKQIDQYLKLALGKDHSLKDVLKKDGLLAGLAKTPLFLSILCLAHRSAPEEVKNLSANNAQEYTRKLFDIYFERILKRKGNKNLYASEQVQNTLAWLAKRMVEQDQSVFYVEQLQPAWLSLPKERFIYYAFSRTSLWFFIGFFGSIGFMSLNTFFIAGLIGAASSLFGLLVGFLDWLSSERNTNIVIVEKQQNKLRKLFPKWGYIFCVQIAVVVLWLTVVVPFFQSPYENLLATILIFVVLCILEAVMFFILWIFDGFLKFFITTILAIALLYISGWISWFLFGHYLVSFLLGVFALYTLIIFLPLRFDTIGNFLGKILGYRGQLKQLSDIRLIENLSWSWKRSLPFFTLAILSALGFLFTVGFRNEVVLWNLDTGEKISTLQSAPFRNFDVSVSYNRDKIFVGDNHNAHVYDAKNSWKESKDLEGYISSDLNIFNLQGTRLLTIGFNSAQLWDTETGKLIHLLDPRQVIDISTVYNNVLQFSSDGNLILENVQTANETDSAIVWDSITGKPILLFYIDSELAQITLRFNPFDGRERIFNINGVSNLLIYGEGELAKNPINLVLAKNGQLCNWVIGLEYDCSKPRSNINSSLMQTNEIYFNHQSGCFYFPEGTDFGDTAITHDWFNRPPFFITIPIYEGGLEAGMRTISIKDSTISVKVYPYSQVSAMGLFFGTKPEAVYPFITITSGNNIAGFIFASILIVSVLATFMAGISTPSIEKKAIPNQGILLSLRNALFLFLVMSLAFGLITGIFYILFSDSSELWMYILGLGILGGSIQSVLYGGMDVIFHYTLRFVLARRDYLPWKLVPFLDYCADNMLLQKVGGGYIFIHRILLENLARKAEN